MFPVTSLAQTSFQTTTPFQTLELDADGIATLDKLSVTVLSGNGQVLAISWPRACVIIDVDANRCDDDIRDVGYVFIYTKGTDRQWIKASTVSMTEVDTRFGASLGISYDGSTIAVGAPAPDEDGEAGAVRIFTRADGEAEWTQQTFPEPDGIEEGDEFGDSVALNDAGDILAVGAPQDNGASDADIDSGAVYIFTRNGDTWTQQTTVLRSQDPTSDVGDEGNFGNSVALNSNGLILAVGAPADPVESNTRVGRVHVFSRSFVTDDWGTPITLRGDNPDSGNLFGASIALNAVGDILAIGSSGENNSAGLVSIPSVGAVYIFKRTGSTWIQPPSEETLREKILPVPLIADRRFGMLVDLNRAGNRLVTNEVGVPNSGAVYLYGFDKFLDTWTELSIIFRTQNLGGVYGHGITVSDDNLVVTSRNFDHEADVFELDPLISDLIIDPENLVITVTINNNSGTVNVNLENTPSSPVTVTADAQEGLTVSPASLDFTNTDPQTFTVTVVDDGVFREQSAVTFRADNYLSTRLAVTIDSQIFIPPTPSTTVSVGGFTNNIPAFSRDGQVMVIGTEDLSTVGVYVINTSGTWELAQTIMSSNPTLSLGTSSDGSMIAIGVSGEDRVDIYSQGSDGMWALQTSVVGTEVSAGHSFGASVVLNDTGSILAVGADSVSPASPLVPGMVYVFQRDEDTGIWTQQIILRPIVPDGIPANEAREGNFGSAVALSGNGLTLVVGSQNRPTINFHPVTGVPRGTHADAGAVYVYSRTSDTEQWDDPNIFAGSDTDNVDFFGTDVALNTAGNILAVGAFGRAAPTTDTDSTIGDPMDSSGPGAVYIFELEENGSWSQQALITPSGISDDNVIRFGASIDLNGAGDRLVAGAPNFIGLTLTGAVYLYGFDDFSDRWHELNMITFTEFLGQAGNFVALSDEYLAAASLSPSPSFAGAADVFELDSLISDLIIDPPDLRIAADGIGTVNVRLEDTPSNPVTITATAGEGLTIDPLELTFSGTVARAFTVTAANNLAGGEQITVNFSADGYITKQLQITIGSADRFLRFPADMVNIQEQSGGVRTTVSVSITDSDTIPTATSATVTITGQNLAGLSFPQFDSESMVLLTTLRDDGLEILVMPHPVYTGNRDVTVILSAPGYTPATMTLRITDASTELNHQR